jgi:hypothetical protein
MTTPNTLPAAPACTTSRIVRSTIARARSAVVPSEIRQLPDLRGYLKFASTRECERGRITD